MLLNIIEIEDVNHLVTLINHKEKTICYYYTNEFKDKQVLPEILQMDNKSLLLKLGSSTNYINGNRNRNNRNVQGQSKSYERDRKTSSNKNKNYDSKNHNKNSNINRTNEKYNKNSSINSSLKDQLKKYYKE